jgi:hypothetical protein
MIKLNCAWARPGYDFYHPECEMNYAVAWFNPSELITIGENTQKEGFRVVSMYGQQIAVLDELNKIFQLLKLSGINLIKATKLVGVGHQDELEIYINPKHIQALYVNFKNETCIWVSGALFLLKERMDELLPMIGETV